jgi:hypothetical protein
MRTSTGVLLAAVLVVAPAGCAQREAASTSPAVSQTNFEVTPAVAATTGATAIVALGILAIVACGIACAQ